MEPSRVDSPFVGLVPYTEDDAEFFFGRSRDQQRILANLFAARLTILYGASGVGKSSVLRAGIVKEVRERIERARAANEEPEVVAVYFKDWKGDSRARLRSAIADSLRGLLGRDLLSGLDESLPLKKLLMEIGKRFPGDLLLIFDQFEEYFLYRPSPAPDQFALEFAEAANQPGLPASFLLALRDDAVTRLDRFKPLIPNLFANYLRIEHLSGEDARSAIVEPIQRFNQLPEDRKGTAGTYEIEPELVATVIEQVRTGRVVIGQVGQGRLAAASATVAVETPYLQLVMTRLWNEEVAQRSHTLRLETLQKLGGADTIVKSHLEAALAGLSQDDRHLCARIFPHLVTPSGTKIAHTVGNLTRYARVTEERLPPLLEALAAKRILAPVAPPDGEPGQLQYEIYHDSLAQAVLTWQARFEEEQERAARKREKRRILITAAAIILALAAGALAAFLGYREARRAENEALALRSETRAQLLERKRLEALANHNQALADQYAREKKQAQDEAAAFSHQANSPSAQSGQVATAEIIRQRDAALKENEDLQGKLKEYENLLRQQSTRPPVLQPPAPQPAAQQPSTQQRAPEEETKKARAAHETAVDDVRLSAWNLSAKDPQLSLALAVYTARKSLRDGAMGDPILKALLIKDAGPTRTIPLRDHTTPAQIEFSHDGKYLAIVDEQGLCLIETASAQATCPPDLAGARLVSWSEDNERLAIGGADTLVAYDVVSGDIKRQSIKGHQVTSLLFSDTRATFVLDRSKEVEAWFPFEPRAWVRTPKFHPAKQAVYSLGRTPEGSLASGTTGRVELWGGGLARLKLKPVWQFFIPGNVRQIVYSQQGVRMAAAADANGRTHIMVWDEPDKLPKSETTIYDVYVPGAAVSIALSPDGGLLATSGASSVTLNALHYNYALSLPAGVPEFSPDGKTFAIAGGGTLSFYPADSVALVAHAKAKSRALTTEECKQYLGLDPCPAY